MTPDQKLFPHNKLMMINNMNDSAKPTFSHTTPQGSGLSELKYPPNVKLQQYHVH
jgi:hypothetical protein